MNRSAQPEKIRCDACPVMCYIAGGKTEACDRYDNHSGELTRLDALTIIENTDQKLVPFLPRGELRKVTSGAKAMNRWTEPIIVGQRKGRIDGAVAPSFPSTKGY